MSVLQINHLTVHRSARVDRTRGVEVLAGIELSLRAGEVTALFGETGCGKTTLINSILGWLPDPLWVTDGRILLSDDRNVDLLQLDQKSRRNYLGLKIGYVPQDVRSGLNPLMNARQTVEEAARRKGQGYRERTDEAFRRAGLEDAFLRDHANRRPGRLSGGQCQRVLIAQAIVNQPTVLLLDEPTASLDPTARIEVLSTLRNLANEGCAICLVSHDFSAVAGIADVVAIMYLGRLVEVGKTDDVLANPMHPYTRALLACVPRLDHHQPLQTIPDGIDATTGTVNGCRFHPRCPLRISRCATEDPLLQELETGRQVACHVVNQINES